MPWDNMENMIIMLKRLKQTTNNIYGGTVVKYSTVNFARAGTGF